MNRYIGILVVAVLLTMACARAPDRVVTEGPFEGESQTQAAPAAQTARDAQPETEYPLCSDIDLPKALERPRQAEPNAVPADPQPARHGRNKITAEYTPRGVASPEAIRIVQTEGSAPSAVHTVPLVTNAQVPPWLMTSARVQNIVVTAERWLMPVTETTRIQFSQFLPGDIEHDAIRVYEVHPSVQGVDRLSGLAFFGSYDESELDTVSFNCFWPWERMSVTPEALALTDRQLAVGDDGHRKSHHILTARWGGAPTRTEPPGGDYSCCDIRVIYTGFFAITPGLSPWWPARWYSCPEASDCYPVLHYSSDGLAWKVVEMPTRYVGSNRYSGHDDVEFPIWVCSVESTATGVIIREAIELDAGWIYEDYGYDDYSGDYLGRDTCNEVTYWSADEDLTNWRKLLAPPPGYD